MISIRPCGDLLEELVRFVTRLNSDDDHHIGFFGEGEAQVRASLAECLIPPTEGFRMAYDDGHLAGVFGVDADPEVDRAWLFGPIVEHTDWHGVADPLYAEILLLIPAGIHDYDLFCDKQNSRVEGFALRHGFGLRSENAVLTLERGDYLPAAKGLSGVIPYRDDFFGQLDRLHRQLFPNAYYTARQMAGKQDGHHRLIIAVENGQLIGYHFCKIEPESQSGYIDFIGTDPAVRNRGIGADLLAPGLDWMLSAPAIQRVNLTVNADNQAARSLYEKFGFTTDRVMSGYRKSVKKEVASRV